MIWLQRQSTILLTRGVRCVGIASLGIKHLLRVPVVRGDAQNVSSLLTSVVDRLDGFVGGADRLDRGIVHSGVADLRLARYVRGLTISGGAKLHMTNSNWSDFTTSATLSATLCTLISGCLSYVATLGEGIIARSSLSYCFSTPPLKKNVTWAYFSVSALQRDSA